MRREVWIDRSAAEVWALLRDPAGVTSWFPNMVEVEVDGDIRTIELTSGLVLVEEFAVHDGLRRFQYRLRGPFPVEQHLASIDVIAVAEGSPRCLVVYSTDVVPHALALILDGAVAEALTSLKQVMEVA